MRQYGGFTFSFYFINPLINKNKDRCVEHYLDDSSFLYFNTQQVTSANLFFNRFNVVTQNNIFPFPQHAANQTGHTVTNKIDIHSYQKPDSQEEYLKLFLRISNRHYEYTRHYERIDQVLSYIGGLFSITSILLSFLSLYSKYSYEIEMGDHLFSQNNGTSYGSGNFNFIVFLGYLFYSIVRIVSECRWSLMEKYR